jgi:hypothetical protein
MTIKLGDVFVEESGKHYGFIVVEHPDRTVLVCNINELGRAPAERVIYHIPANYVPAHLDECLHGMPWWVGLKHSSEFDVGKTFGRAGKPYPYWASDHFQRGYREGASSIVDLNYAC